MTSPTSLARTLRAVLLRERGGDLRQACTTANNVLHRLRPSTERWIGTFDGEPHEWARLDGWFVDVTVSQFPGGPELVVATELDGRWAGRRADWQPSAAWPPGKQEEVAALARLVERDPGTDRTRPGRR